MGWGGPGDPYAPDRNQCWGLWIQRVALRSGSASDHSVQMPLPPTNSSYWHLPVSADSSQIPVFADSVWVEGWPLSTDSPPGNSQLGPAPSIANAPSATIPTASNYMQEFCINRHVERRVNIVFLDGHADSFDLPELWSPAGGNTVIKWSPGYTSPSSVPVP